MNTTIDFGMSELVQAPILIIWTKFAQKGYFKSKTENVNITIEFYIFNIIV